MKKLNKLIIIALLMMILFILSTSVLYKASAMEDVPGVGYKDSLIGRFCCQQNTALWSPNIESTYKKWYIRDLPYGSIQPTIDREIENQEICNKLSDYASTGFGGLYDLGATDYYSLFNQTFGMREGETYQAEWGTAGPDGNPQHCVYTVFKYIITNNAFGVKLDPYIEVKHDWGDAAETYIANHCDGYFDGGSPGPGQYLWWQTNTGRWKSEM